MSRCALDTAQRVSFPRSTRGRGFGRLCAPVGGRPDTSSPLRASGRNARSQFARTKDLTVKGEFPRPGKPQFSLRDVRIVLRAVQDARLPKPDILAHLSTEFAPAPDALHRERQLMEVPVLLTYPAPIAA